MKVTLIAFTHLNMDAFEDDEFPYTLHPFVPDDTWVRDSDELAEFAGRACYESWNRPNPKTATNEEYIGHIVEVGHFSVLEHASATFYITGVPRSFTHELVRHRHMSFSQLSQRYVDESESNVVIPPNGDDVEEELIRGHHADSKSLYLYLVQRRIDEGQTRKQAREAGRAVLPNATETRIVVTGNMRAWRELLAKRLSPGADAAFQKVAAMILKELMDIAPNTFQDFA